jgi:biopolymer transport protein ExbB/TolQ
MFNLFMQGGAGWMSILTLELIALLLAAWKAPGWVKEIGKIALVTGLFSTMLGLSQAGAAIQAAGDISTGMLWGGIRVALITVMYGTLIYLVSLVIRIVQKPRFM